MSALFAAILALLALVMLFAGLLLACIQDEGWSVLMLYGIGLAIVACVWAILGTGAPG